MSEDNIKVYSLENSVPVLMDKIQGINSISLGIFVKTGAKNELAGEEGISHFIEHMMFKGTVNRTAKEISEEVDNVGGIINAYTGKETTTYYIQLLSNRIDVGIDILTDMFLNSTFLEENIEREKGVVVEEINMYEDIPEEIIHDKNGSLVIEGPQSNTILGTVESVQGLNREKILKYFKEQYSPKNLVISIAGNFSESEVLEKLNSGIGKMKSIEKSRDYNGEMKIKTPKTILKKDSNQVHLCFNTIGRSSLDKNRYELAIISNTLGGNMSSRLFQKIREDRGLAYSVYSYTSSFEEGGILTIYAGTTLKDYKTVIKLIKEEFEDIKNNGISEKELQKTKNQFLSGITFGLESSKGRMTRMANSYLFHGEVKSLEEILGEIEKITVEDIKKLAKEIFNEKYYSLTVLGNIKEGELN